MPVTKSSIKQSVRAAEATPRRRRRSRVEYVGSGKTKPCPVHGGKMRDVGRCLCGEIHWECRVCESTYHV